MPESQSSLAIVLRWRAYGESDKIATLLTRDFGKLTGIAKGARNSRRRFANSLEALARVRVHFRRRPQASLAFLEHCDLLAPAGALSDPARFAYASYLAELTDRLTPDEDPVPALYALLDEGLTALEGGPATGTFLRGFELQLLARAGFEPRLDRCARCQSVWAPSQTVFLDTAHGVLWCAGCRREGEATVEVAEAVCSRLVDFGRLPLARCRERSLGADAADAAQLTGRLLALHLVRPLRSVKLIGQLAGAGTAAGSAR